MLGLGPIEIFVLVILMGGFLAFVGSTAVLLFRLFHTPKDHG